MKRAFLLLAIALLLAGTGEAGQQDDARAKLLKRQKTLTRKIEALKREQDFLLFQKTLYESDSKYLVVRTGRKWGQLKYKNRVLRNFRFPSPLKGRNIQRGNKELTEKIGSDGKRYALFFGNSFVLQIKGAPAVRLKARTPRIPLSRKDFMAIFRALETGSRAYILP